MLVHHFVAKGFEKQTELWGKSSGDVLEADLEFLMVAVRKVEQIREDLGKVGPVIAAQVDEAMLGRRTRLQTEQAERESEPVRRILKFERDLWAQIFRHMEQLQETRRDMNISPENVLSIVETALALARQRPLIETEVDGVWTRESNPGASCEAFELPALSGSWATAIEGLAHPHTGIIRPIVFDQNLARDTDKVVLAHLNHRLVQMSLRLLRAEVWSPRSKKGLHRITARVVPDTILDTPAVVAHARLVVIGGDHHRLHEEIISAGGFLREGRFSRMNVTQNTQAVAAGTTEEPSQEMKKRLLDLYPKIIPQLLQSLEVRKDERMGGIQKQLAEREELEAKNIEFILNELARAIEIELNEPEVYQLELFSLEEKDQLSRNVDALRRRLQAIPDEIKAEKI